MRGRLRRFGDVGLERISDHPLKAASAIAVLAATAVLVLGVLATPGVSLSDPEAASVAVAALVQFSLERPAYPVAVLVGLAVLFTR